METIECKEMEDEILLEEESEPLDSTTVVREFFLMMGVHTLIILGPISSTLTKLETKVISIVHQVVPYNLVQALLSPTTYLVTFKMVDDSNYPHTIMVLPDWVVRHSDYLMRILSRDFKEEYKRFDLTTKTFTKDVDKDGLGAFLLPIGLDKDVIQTPYHLGQIHMSLLYYYDRFHDDLVSDSIHPLRVFISKPEYVEFINYLGFDMRIKEIEDL